MRYMSGMGDATNPLNLPGLPGYDPTQPAGVQIPTAPAVVVQPGALQPVSIGPVPAFPTTGSPMDPTLKAQFIAAVPSLSAAQQQDLYDIGAATTQFSSARLMWAGGGLVLGAAAGYFAAKKLKR